MKYDPALHVIPPGCEYFRIVADYPCWVLRNGDYELLSEVFTEPQYKRGIVCAVAYTAWMKEAGRLYKVGLMTARNDPDNEITDEGERIFKDSDTAKQNAAAWLELMEEKKQPCISFQN